MLDVSKQSLVLWTISKGFPHFKETIQIPTNYLKKSQINYIQNVIKETSYYHEFCWLKRKRGVDAANTLPRPILDKPDHLNDEAISVADFLKEIGVRLSELSGNLEALYSKPFKLFTEKLKKINLNDRIDLIFDEIQINLNNFSENKKIILSQVENEIEVIKDQFIGWLSNLKEDISKKIKLEKKLKELKESNAYCIQNPQINMLLNKLFGEIDNFEKGFVSELDLIHSIEPLELQILSFKFQVLLSENDSLLENLLTAIISLKLEIENKAHLLDQLDIVEHYLLNFFSSRNVIFDPYFLLDQDQVDTLKKQVLLIKSEGSHLEGEAAFKKKVLIEKCIKNINKKTPSKTYEIMDMFLDHLKIITENEQQETELHNIEPDMFPMDDIVVNTPEKKTPSITPNSVRDLPSRPDFSLLSLESVSFINSEFPSEIELKIPSARTPPQLKSSTPPLDSKKKLSMGFFSHYISSFRQQTAYTLLKTPDDEESPLEGASF